MQLFDDFVRTDDTSSRHTENEYDFLNRSFWNVSVRARELCHSWFEEYPEADRADLRGRFISGDEGQHLGAYFELVVHELLCRLGFSITVHPTIPGISKHPDFLAQSDDQSFYLETTVSLASGSDIPENATLHQIYEWIDEIEDRHFLVGVRPSGLPTKQPSRKDIQAPIRHLMAKSDPEQVLRRFENGHRYPAHLPSVTIPLEGCNLFVELVPKRRDKWGVSARRTIAAWYGGGIGNQPRTIGVMIDKKAREKRVARLDAPLVVACSVSDGFYSFQEEGLVSLFGEHNRDYEGPGWNMRLGTRRIEEGIWIGKDGSPRNTNLAAVWLFKNVRPIAPAPVGSGNRLFLNPFARDPLPRELLRLATAHVCNGQMIWTNGIDLSELLDVPEIPYEDLRVAAAT